MLLFSVPESRKMRSLYLGNRMLRTLGLLAEHYLWEGKVLLYSHASA